MQFYQEFSTYYDDIFQTKDAKVEFLADHLESDAEILDVAAGTGNYAIALAQQGYSVQGLDLSPAMIAQAQEKIKDAALNLKFQVGDMREVATIYSKQNFDLIYCIGNSLVHLENEEEIKDVLTEFYRLLKPNANLILQIVNYNRILENNITSLPTINNYKKHVKLIRHYELVSDEQVNFKTELITSNGVFKNSVPLYPLRAKKLKRLVNEVGYTAIDLYGDFAYNDYQANASFPLIAVITK